MIALLNYQISAIIHEDSQIILYRGIRKADHVPVIIKTANNAYPHPSAIARLQHEYDIIRDLDMPGVCSAYALEPCSNGLALILKDQPGQSLRELIAAGLLDLAAILSVGRAVAGVLGDLHQRGIIHKDIKPHNILFDQATGHVTLIDFDIASRLSREHPSLTAPNVIEGTLAYMSPEQTGRMNRHIDYRTDFYSLGVTLYEALTGTLPFQANDALELMHSHIAKLPSPPDSLVASIPAMVSAIVLKLMAKTAEDRYQSAYGLRSDLERCLTELAASGQIAAFPLAEHDVADTLHLPQHLYGREHEIQTLLAAFERVVATKSPELVLVAGYSGIGKSALVHELHKPIIRERGFFAAGKFDQFKRDIPYVTIVQAFTELVSELLTESEAQIAAWREQLLAALSINAQLIVDVIPSVELVIGPQPPVAELSAGEAQNRFRTVFRSFIGVFAQQEHPLALFLDDLQWVDSASLALLQDLVTNAEIHHLLVIGAYRDNEVSAAHPLMLTLDAVRGAGTPVANVVLGPFSRDDLGAFISDALHCSPAEIGPLADLVQQKTAGNPFFTIQFLTTLYERHLLAFDEHSGVWRWDLAQIHAQGFTDNVVDLMVGKLQRLPEATRAALMQMACLGTSADSATLTIVHGGSEATVHSDLWEAVRGGFVTRLGDNYKFLHDRIQEATYSLIPESERPMVHLRTGRLLLAALDEPAISERIFDLVAQLNRGVKLISDPHEIAELSGLNVQAGRKAKAAIAYAAARSYLVQAADLLLPTAWDDRYADTFSLYLEMSECEYLAGDFAQADELFNLLLAKARANADRARVYRLRLRLYQVSGRYDEGMDVALAALALFGVTCPEQDEEIMAAFMAELQAVPAMLAGRQISDLDAAPIITDPDVLAMLGIIVDTMPCAYIARAQLFPLLAVKALNVSLRHGNAEESAFAYSVYAMILVGALGDIAAGFQYSELALRINEKFNDLKLKGSLLYIHSAHISCWSRPIATIFATLDRSFRACLDGGNLSYAGFNCFITVWHLIEKGEPLDEVLKLSPKYAEFARQSHNEVIYQQVRLEEQFVANLQGATPDPLSFDDSSFSEEAYVALHTKAGYFPGIAYFHILKQIAAFTYGRYDESLAAADNMPPMMAAVMGFMIESTYHFYRALTLTALYGRASAEQQPAVIESLAPHRAKLKLWVENCPANHLNRHLLVEAEVARIEGRDNEAMRLYEQAIRSAGENGFVQNEGLANELAAQFYDQRGFDKIADTYLREARNCYVRWGAAGKLKQFDQLHPHIHERRALVTSDTDTVETAQLDALSIVKASQAISGEIALDKLLSTLIQVVIEQAGAQKGYVILRRNGSLAIEAEASLNEQGGAEVTLLRSLPAAASPLLPAAIVNYVARTRQHVLLEHAAEAVKFAADAYILRTQPKSVLCMPIIKQAELIGLLYLENNLATGAFTAERLEILHLLVSQAAIALQNAQLYGELAEANRTLEQKVATRTAELAQATAEAQAARGVAEEANEMKTKFLANMSHELRTPLNAIINFSRIVMNGICGPVTEMQHTYLDRVRVNGEHLLGLINDILDLSKIEAGRLDLFTEPVVIEYLVRETMATVTGLLNDRPVILHHELASDLPVVMADPTRVRQVLLNLLSNAVKFTDEGSITVRAAQEGDELVLRVTDTGIGIDPEDAIKIFEEFRQADDSGTRRYEGTGLGLTISQRLVEMHNGRIWVESERGVGSTFAFSLPLTPTAEDPGQLALDNPATAGG